MISHLVKDFDAWKIAFEAEEAELEQAGIKVTGIYRSPDQENMVTVVSEANNLKMAKAMINSPEYKIALAKAGVISTTGFKILTQAN